MARPHIAAVIEDAFFERLGSRLRRVGWGPRIIGFTGYGSVDFARILGRVLLTDHDSALEPGVVAHARATEAELDEAQAMQRGWKNFLAAPAVEVPVTVHFGARTVQTCTDRGGYLDLMLRDHGLEPGWHEARIEVVGAETVCTAVLVIGSEVTRGLVSDIDDTVMITHLPRLLIAAWNTFVSTEQARQEVPGMAHLYREVLADAPGAPTFYLSTGAWNTAPTLSRFLKRHEYPRGPLLLTDWGPTNTGWFRSGMEHKMKQLHRLAAEFPHIQWVLVGDDGQHDPKIYTDFAHERPDVVDFIAIRELTTTEQVLSHGLPVANEEILGTKTVEVPIIRGADGHRILGKVRTVLGEARSRFARATGATPVDPENLPGTKG